MKCRALSGMGLMRVPSLTGHASAVNLQRAGLLWHAGTEVCVFSGSNQFDLTNYSYSLLGTAP